MTKLTNKVIWITGASSGIGEALVYELAKKDTKLILSSRRSEELERVKQNCPAGTHKNIHILTLDLSDSSSLQRITETAIQLFGHIDVLINNGGISQRSLTKETHLDVDRKLMEVDFFGTIALSKYLLPHFLNRKSGHYVTVTSVMGKIGTPYRSAYAAAKHALHGFFDSLRAEVWRDSIYVTLICPGWVKTNIALHALTGDGQPLNQHDIKNRSGLDPQVCAARIVRAIELRKEEVYIGGFKEVFAVYLKRFFPILFSRMVRKAVVVNIATVKK